MRVLLIEDDPVAAEALIELLKSAKMQVVHVQYGADGADIPKYDSNFNICILDLMLADMDGLRVLTSLRSAKIKIPVLILSGLSSVDHKIKALGLGADDYLTKPFNRGELIARINAIVRRSQGHAESVIRFDKVVLNLDSRTVEVAGTPVHLTNKEYAILELLAMRKGTVLTKEVFLNHLYGGMDEPEIKIIDVFVCKLRKKLADASGGTNYVDTIWGRGYMLKNFEQTSDEHYLSGETPSSATSISDVIIDEDTEFVS